MSQSYSVGGSSDAAFTVSTAATSLTSHFLNNNNNDRLTAFDPGQPG